MRVLLLVLTGLLAAAPCVGEQLVNKDISLLVDAPQGSWSIGFPDGPVILRSRTAAEVDHHWLRSSDYPGQATRQAAFTDALGSGTELVVTCSGLREAPELIYSLRLYAQQPFATLQVSVRNTTAREVRVATLRAVEAVGDDILELRGPAAADRV